MGTAAPSTSAASTPTPAPAAEPTAEPTRRIAPIPPKATAPAPDKTAKGTNAATPGGEGDGGGIDGRTEAPASREVLPGVVVGGDIELPTRGPDGKFQSRKAAVDAFERELAGEDEPAPTSPDKPAAEPTKPPLPGQTGKVSFLGKEYNSIAEVEQLHRTLQGMHGPIAQKAAALEKERDYGYQAANAWQQEAEKARAELEQYRASVEGRRPAGQPAVQEGAPDAGDLDLNGLIDGIDYNAFEMIAHDPAGGTRVAGKFLASQILNTVIGQLMPAIKADIMKQVGPILEPVKRDQASQATANAIGTVIDGVSQLRTHTGALAFPELGDEAELAEIGRTWAESGLPPQAALTQSGLITAIGLYRLMKSLPDGTPVPAAAVAAAEAAISPAAAALADGGGGADTGLGRSSRDDAHLSPDARRIRDAFDSGPLFEKNLGFAKNRRTA